ncbi:MAG: hypothetical protein V4621_03815 [Pseudomonadota bacterium]
MNASILAQPQVHGPKKPRGRPARSVAKPDTIAAWFCKTTGSPTRDQTIAAYNTALADKQDYAILDKSLIGAYSPFVLSIVEAFSKSAHGNPKADTTALCLSSDQRGKILEAMQQGLDSGKNPLPRHMTSKLKLAGILYYAQLAALKLSDRLDCIDIHASSLTRRSEFQRVIDARKLQSLDTIWFDQRLASRHRRVTIDAEAAAYYAPDTNMRDLCEIVRNCDGKDFSTIIQPTPRLSGIATENALRIAFAAHSCATHLTMVHGRNADILGYTAIGEMGRTVTEILQVNGMGRDSIQTVEKHLAEQAAFFERDRTKTAWMPQQAKL